MSSPSENLSPDAERWVAPPRPTTRSGDARAVGVEIEFGNLDVRRTVEIVRDLWGGTIEPRGDHHATISGAAFGDFVVTLDTRFAKGGETETARMVRNAIGHAASLCLARAIARGIYHATARPGDRFRRPSVSGAGEGLTAASRATRAGPPSPWIV